MTKKEAFINRPAAWLLSSPGRLPDRSRGRRPGGDGHHARRSSSAATASSSSPRARARGPGPLGRPKRGVGRLALETGAPVVPVAIIGSEAVRKGWRIRPHKVRIRAGAPLTFPKVHEPSRHLAAAVTDRIWPCVELQWEWLGGTPRVRRAAVIGAGAWGTSLAVALARAGLEVDLGTRARRAARDRRAAARRHLGAPRRATSRSPTTTSSASPSRPRELPGDRRRARREASPSAPACSCAPRASSRRSARCRAPTSASAREAHAVACLGGPGAAADELAPRRRARRRLRQPGLPGPDRRRAARRALRGAAHHRRHRRRARRRRPQRRRARRLGRRARGRQRGRRRRRHGARRGRRLRAPSGRPPGALRRPGRRRRQRPGARRPAAARRRPARGRRRRPGRRRPGRRRRRPRRARALGRRRDASRPGRGRGALPE